MAVRGLTFAHLWLTITLVVSIAWAVNMVIPLLNTAYHPDPSINSLFMVVVGGIVTVQVERAEVRRDHNRSQRREDND